MGIGLSDKIIIENILKKLKKNPKVCEIGAQQLNFQLDEYQKT